MTISGLLLEWGQLVFSKDHMFSVSYTQLELTWFAICHNSQAALELAGTQELQWCWHARIIAHQQEDISND